MKQLQTIVKQVYHSQSITQCLNLELKQEITRKIPISIEQQMRPGQSTEIRRNDTSSRAGRPSAAGGGGSARQCAAACSLAGQRRAAGQGRAPACPRVRGPGRGCEGTERGVGDGRTGAAEQRQPPAPGARGRGATAIFFAHGKGKSLRRPGPWPMLLWARLRSQLLESLPFFLELLSSQNKR
jgi:hypothetical protein